MRVAESHGPGEVQAFLKLGLRFPGKSHYDVGGDCCVWNLGPYPLDGVGKSPGIITPAHCLQDAVGAALQWNVEVGTQARVPP